MATINKLAAHLIPLHWGQRDFENLKRITPRSIKTIYGFDRVPVDYWKASPNSLFGLRDHAMSEQHNDLMSNPVETGKRHAREWMEKLKNWNWTHIPIDQIYVHSINEPAVWLTDVQFAQTRNLSEVGTFEYMAFLKQQAYEQMRYMFELNFASMSRKLTLRENEDYSRGVEELSNLTNTIGIKRTVEYTEAWLDSLTSYGIRGTALNLSVGWPANAGIDMPPVWTPYKSLEAKILKGNHFLVVHEYWPKEGPEKHWGWMAGRVLKCPFNVPIIIGECGQEERVVNSNLPSEKWGWQAWLTIDQYLDQLNRYNLAMQDPRIHSLQIFTWDFSHPFGSTDIRPLIDRLPTNNNFDKMLNWTNDKPETPELPTDPNDPNVVGLEQDLLKLGEKYQVIQFNIDAALQKRIFADNFVPNSPEFEYNYQNVIYVAQRAENLQTGKVRVYYVAKGDWGNVKYAERK
jgi:hypothetical protein